MFKLRQFSVFLKAERFATTIFTKDKRTGSRKIFLALETGTNTKAFSSGGASSSNIRKEMEIAIPVPWGHVAGKSWNDTNGLRVLFVHGLQDNAGSFDTLIPLLPKTYHCIAIDLPGHGKSSHLPKGLPIRTLDFTATIDRVVNFLGWDKFIYIGHSLGAYLGSYYCAIFKDRVNKFINLDSFIVGMSNDMCVDNIVRTYRKLKTIEEQVEFGKPPEYSYESAVQRLREGRPDPIFEKTAKLLAKRSLVKYGNGYRFSMDQRLKAYERTRMNEEQHNELLSRIKCPVLHIMTSESLRLSYELEELERVKAMFKMSLGESYRFVVVEGYHSVHIEYPERVVDLIVKFLANTKSQL